MPDFYEELVNYSVFPTEQDHHGAQPVGSARIATEVMFTGVLDLALGRGNYIVSGFTLPPNGDPITAAHVAAGAAIIDGHYIVGASDVHVQLSDGATNYLYLKLEYDGDIVERPLIEVNTTGTTPAHAAFLGYLTTSGGSVVNDSQHHWRTGPRIVYGVAEISGSTCTKVSAGGRQWNITGSGGSYTITFDDGSFINKPVFIPHLLNLSPGAQTNIIIADGASNDEVDFYTYQWDAVNSEWDSCTAFTISFIACG